MVKKRSLGTGRQRPYAPHGSFATNLGELADYFRTNGLAFSEKIADTEHKYTPELLLDLQGRQQADEKRDAELWDGFVDHHNPYMARQAERFKTFMRALEFARTEGKRDPQKRATLGRLRQTAGSAVRGGRRVGSGEEGGK